jgi:hypothetical protein
MANIPAITPIEVSSSVKKIIEAYAGLNAKLNSIFAVKEIEKELELDPDFLNILKDTTNKSLWDVNNTKEKPATQKPKKFNKNSTIKEKKAVFSK